MTKRVGLVVAGAGARGAYEAGALSALVPRMADTGSTPSVFVGTSAGALNVVGLAGLAHLGVQEAADQLVDMWRSVQLGQVVDIAASVAGTGLGYTRQLLGWPKRLRCLLDTAPQRATLERLLPWEGLHDNIARGTVDAVAVTTTSVATGGTVVFVEKKPSVSLPLSDPDRNITYVETTLTVEHVLASAAVPVVFRPVEVGSPSTSRGWYVDGGLRLNVPLKPAIDLGCDRLGVVATEPASWAQDPTVGLPAAEGGPDLFAAASLTLRALLADRMVEDLQTLQMVNRLLRPGASKRYRSIDFLFAGPSSSQANDLATLANQVFHREYGSLKGVRNPALWVFDRLIGGAAPDHGGLLSFFFFDSTFATAAANLGIDHASAQLSDVSRSSRWSR